MDGIGPKRRGDRGRLEDEKNHRLATLVLCASQQRTRTAVIAASTYSRHIAVVVNNERSPRPVLVDSDRSITCVRKWSAANPSMRSPDSTDVLDFAKQKWQTFSTVFALARHVLLRRNVVIAHNIPAMPRIKRTWRGEVRVDGKNEKKINNK